MKTLNIILDAAGYKCVRVNGKFIPLTLEVMNIAAPNEMNGEFYSEEADFAWDAKEEQNNLNDKNNTIDTDEVRQARIDFYLSAVQFSKDFVLNNKSI